MLVLLRPTRTNQWKCCETGPTVFRPYPRRLESLTICRCQRPWVSARPGFEPATSRSADRRSPNWANKAAVNLDLLNDLGPFLMSIILFQIDSDGFTDLEMHTLCHVCNWMSACLRLSASFISTLMALDCFCATLRPLFYRTKVTCVDVVKIIGCGILLAAFILNGEGLQTL